MANDNTRLRLKQITDKFKAKSFKSRYSLEQADTIQEVKELISTLIKELKKIGE